MKRRVHQREVDEKGYQKGMKWKRKKTGQGEKKNVMGADKEQR